MTVMISGGTGFVGLNLAEALLARGEHVVVFARDTVPGRARAVFATLPGRLTELVGDVTDTETFTAALRTHAVDRMFPFAAITSGPVREAETPELVIQVNLLGLIGQLRAARDAGVARIIVPASGAVYGESYWNHALLDEVTTPCVPTGVYGVTKYAAERASLRLAGLWGLDVVVARIGSLFGPWERDTGLRDLLTPHWALARAAVAGEHAVLPAELPDYAWIYSRDLAAALVHLLDLPNPPARVFNLCSGRNWGSVMTRFADILAATYPKFSWSHASDPADVTIRLTETRPRGRMDITRLLAAGWSPAYDPEAAYADYALWLTRNGLAG